MATFEELTNIQVTDEPAERPLETIHQSGADTRRAAGDEAAALRENTTGGDVLGAAWERNITPMMVDTIQRKWDNEPEAGFSPTDWVNENKDTLVGTNLEAFSYARSAAEAEQLRVDQQRAADNDALIASRGVGGVAAAVLVGFGDPVELGLGIATAGYGKAATSASRIARTANNIGRATVAGAKGALASSTAYGIVDPLSDSKQIVIGALSGAVLSTTLSAAAQPFNRSTAKARAMYAREVDDLGDASVTPTENPVYRLMPEQRADQDAGIQMDQSGSIGAARVLPTVQDAGLIPEGPNRDIYIQAKEQIAREHIDLRADEVNDMMSADNPVARTAKRFSDMLSTKLYEPLKTDFDRLMYSGSDIERSLAYNLLESAEGRVRNNRSGAMLKETYEQRMASQSLPVLEDMFQGWAHKRNIGMIDRNRASTRAAFDREVILELEARFHDGSPVSTDPLIKRSADAVDANYMEALKIAKGRDGETSVSGFEDIQPKSGFFNHKWNGQAIRKAKAAGHSDAKIEAVLNKGMAQTYPDMPPADAAMISKAIVRRAKARADGVDTNMLSTLDSDATEYLTEMLRDSGYSQEHITRLVDSIRGKKAEQGKLGTTKKRVQVDLRTEIDGLSLLDLVDSNLTRVLSVYNREVSGNAALARKGIPDRQTRKQFIEAALHERRAKGLPADAAQRTYLEEMFTYFDSGPVGGGVDVNVSRAKRITNLALLNQMGMTQMGETGAQIAAVGMETWKHHAKSVFTEMRTQGPTGPIASELRPWMGDIGNEHMLFRDDLMLDELKDATDLNTFLGKLDFSLGKGQRLQGYASGFFHARAFQQKVAVISMADKVFQRIRDNDLDVVAEALGMDTYTLSKYIDSGDVTFDKDGFVEKLGMDNWSEADAEDFALALNRHTHQVVQKAMAGEENVWMHKTVGSLMTHLKSFPLTAMRKQSVRVATGHAPTAVATLLLGLATAGLAYEARQMINGRTDRISGEDAIKGAMGMSNMTGWVPMLVDPAAAMLGMNDLRFNQYGRHDISTGVVPTPPVIPTLNKMLQGVGAVNPLSDLSANERIRIMQTMPLVGNAYGFAAIFNAMKQ
jgi:hypothetical protein